MISEAFEKPPVIVDGSAITVIAPRRQFYEKTPHHAVAFPSTAH